MYLNKRSSEYTRLDFNRYMYCLYWNKTLYQYNLLDPHDWIWLAARIREKSICPYWSWAREKWFAQILHKSWVTQLLPAQITRNHLQRTWVDQVILTRDSAQTRSPHVLNLHDHATRCNPTSWFETVVHKLSVENTWLSGRDINHLWSASVNRWLSRLQLWLCNPVWNCT